MIRPMTSDVSALSGIVANGHQAIHFVSSAPLRFRTVGFPQYGSKQAVRSTLRHLAATLMPPQWLSRPWAFCSVVGLASGGTHGF